MAWQVVPGDYAPLLARVVAHLEVAKKHAANATQEVCVCVCVCVCV